MSRRSRSQDRIIWDQLFAVSPGNPVSLQTQLQERIVAAIFNRYYPGSQALPSCRELARHLGIARNTVVRAYNSLVANGFLTARRGSGFYVNTDILNGKLKFDPQQGTTSERFDWDGRFCLQLPVDSDNDRQCPWNRYPYPFVSGEPDADFTPIAGWRECCREALSPQAMQRWVTDGIEFEDPLLIEQLQTRLLPRRGIWASSDEILITASVQQARYFIASLLMSTGTTVGLEEPGCLEVRKLFALKGARLIGLPVDHAGLRVDYRLDDCDYVYVTPNHQYPTTVTMSAQRRRDFLDYALTADFAVVEEDYESEFNFLSEASPALKNFDRDDRVIYVGSVSRALLPGLDLAYVVAPAKLIRVLRALRQLTFRHPFAHGQQAFAHFLARGHYDALLYRLNRSYKERWQALSDVLERYLPELAIMPLSGGTACWIKGPSGLDAEELQRKAKADGILIEASNRYFWSDCAQSNFIRLGFGSIPVERIEPGIRQLARLIRRMLATAQREFGHRIA